MKAERIQYSITMRGHKVVNYQAQSGKRQHTHLSNLARLLITIIGSLSLGVAAPFAMAEPNGRMGFENPTIVENALDIWRQEGADWPRWAAHDKNSTFVVDHSWWENFMADHTDRHDGIGVLDYVYVSNRGLGGLASYVYALQHVPVSKLSRDEQLAFWLNLHNALAAQTTAQSLDSIAQWSATTRHLVLGKPWREKNVEVEGQSLSLVDIERRILMRQWNDPRVLYGIHLPALGAPALPAKPFTGDSVWKMLENRARAFVNSDQALEFHGDDIHVSSLYFWDDQLFNNEAEVLNHLQHFATAERRAQIAKLDAIKATYLNWRLVTFNSGYDRHQDRQGGS